MQPHSFEVSAEWRGGSQGSGMLNSPSGLHCQFAVPTEFGGPGGCPSPEEMFLASIASCYVITLAYIAQTKKLPLQSQTIHI
ncbi:MAG: OsmC family protein, partial [Fimbriimonadales bacterium]